MRNCLLSELGYSDELPKDIDAPVAMMAKKPGTFGRACAG